jgi:hypothetical protein
MYFSTYSNIFANFPGAVCAVFVCLMNLYEITQACEKTSKEVNL